MEGTKRKLFLNISFLNLTDFTKQSGARKSPRNFEERDGPVGLGILAAADDHQRDGDPDLNRKGVIVTSPKSASNAISVLGKTGFRCVNVGSWEEADSQEEYTCVISHKGGDLIEKREYFGCVSAENVLGPSFVPENGISGSVTPSSSSIGDLVATDFLNSCFLCKKMLQGLDIFMYRGLAFCSPECRDCQISIEKKEKEKKCQSRLRKPTEYSSSPCSDSQSLSAEAVAA